MNLNEYLQMTANDIKANSGVYQDVRKRLLCKDGTLLSVQASESHYCSPRVNSNKTDWYSEVEVWCVSVDVPDSWYKYGSEDDPHAYIPVELVEAFIEQHGGIAGQEREA